MKIFAILVAIIFTFSIIPLLPAAEIGIKIPFGQGAQPQKNRIEKLKDEDTSGAWTGIGLIVLGAAIVAAAIIIVNEVNDVQEDADEKFEEVKDNL